MTITISNALAATFAADVISALGANAPCEIYTGSKPADPSVAPNGTTQILLGTLTCASTPGTYAARRLTFNAITQDSVADNGGTAAWARFRTTGGVGVIDVDIGAVGGSAFMQINNPVILAGGPIAINSCYIDF